MDIPDYTAQRIASRGSDAIAVVEGVQGEAPALGKPVLVMRNTTERPEAVEAGTVKLVGTNTQKIVSEVTRLLHDFVYYERMSKASNPYGDGKAASRIVEYFQ